MLGLIFAVKVIVLFAIASLFAFFDIFNNRDIPNIVAYIGLAIAAILFVTNPISVILVGIAVAIFFGAAGYLLYVAGQLGAGDVIEFIIIALILPVQPLPKLININQFGLPFVFSVFINAGFIAILSVPAIYLVSAHGSKIRLSVSRNNAVKGTSLFLIYVAFALMLVYLFGMNVIGIIFILLVAIASAVLMFFEDTISKSMVKLINPRELSEGDIIEIKSMSENDIRFFSAKSKHFKRLATKELIKDLKGVNRKLPVYRNGIPFAIFLLAGILTALAFGNIILLII